jgi:hypothetical protein
MGVALLAVFAIGGSAASAASAAEFHFEKPTTYLSGSQQGKTLFNAGVATDKCNKATFSAKVTGATSKMLEVAPAYECSLAGAQITWQMNGCTHQITADAKNSGKLAIVCPAGKQIDIAYPGGCHVYIPPQSPSASNVTFSASGAGAERNVLVGLNLNLSTTIVGPGAVCGPEGPGKATMTGTVLLNGFSNEKLTQRAGFWVE